MLNLEELLKSALHLIEPWGVIDILFSEEEKKLEIWIQYKRGFKFPCPICEKVDCYVYDTNPRSWQHLNFFENSTLIHARIPRVICSECGIHQITIPWSREESGFTSLLEADMVCLAHTTHILDISKRYNVTDKRVWRYPLQNKGKI